MPGNKSASDKPESGATWQTLTLRESGGFAGLLRGVSVQRQQLDGAACRRVDRLLLTLQADAPSPADSPALRDGQQLQLQVMAGSQRWEACYSTADLPDEASKLLDLLPPLRPLPRA